MARIAKMGGLINIAANSTILGVELERNIASGVLERSEVLAASSTSHALTIPEAEGNLRTVTDVRIELDNGTNVPITNVTSTPTSLTFTTAALATGGRLYYSVGQEEDVKVRPTNVTAVIATVPGAEQIEGNGIILLHNGSNGGFTQNPYLATGIYEVNAVVRAVITNT